MSKKLQPLAKAVAPAALTVVATLIDWLVVGTFEKETLAIALTGLIASVVTYFVPNSTQSPPAP